MLKGDWALAAVDQLFAGEMGGVGGREQKEAGGSSREGEREGEGLIEGWWSREGGEEQEQQDNADSTGTIKLKGEWGPVRMQRKQHFLFRCAFGD